MKKLSDEWETPQDLFDELNKEFNFDVDLCATKENSKCQQFYIDYLNDIKLDHTGFAGNKEYRPLKHKYNCAFMNPPYSNPKPFILKAWEDSKHCKIVCLVKCDPSTKWWATFWDYEPACYCKCNPQDEYCPISIGAKPGCEVRFFPKRIKFDPPNPENYCQGGHVYGSTWIGSVRCCQTCHKPKVTSSVFPCALIIMDRRSI